MAKRMTASRPWTDRDYEMMAKLANFLFPKHGEWKWYHSPGGYSFLKIVTRKEQETC